MEYQFSSACGRHPSTIPMRWTANLDNDDAAREQADVLYLFVEAGRWVSVVLSDGSIYDARLPDAC